MAEKYTTIFRSGWVDFNATKKPRISRWQVPLGLRRN